jgi:hypothetical protein
MEKFLQNLSAQAEQNPLLALAIASGLMTAGAKLIKAHGESKGSRAYAKDVDRRIKASRR